MGWGFAASVFSLAAFYFLDLPTPPVIICVLEAALYLSIFIKNVPRSAAAV